MNEAVPHQTNSLESGRTRVGINGFGRIGRLALRFILESNSSLEIVGINDLTDQKTLAHLFKYDSVHGQFGGEVKPIDDGIMIRNLFIPISAERNPENLKWDELGADVVLECTGLFTEREKAAAHIRAGAKKVLLSAPGKNADATIVMGVNEDSYNSEQHHVVSNASCTTNCLAPVVQILNKEFGVENGFMTTVHASTNDQRILDLPHEDLRRARSAMQNIIPTSTGAAKAIGLVLPNLAGKLDGMAMRVPTVDVSVIDLSVRLGREATADEINDAFVRRAFEIPHIFGVEDSPLVSSDYIGDTRSSIVDSEFTKVNQQLAKVLAWYDNEAAYAKRLTELASFVGGKG